MKKNNILIAVLVSLILIFVMTNYFKKNSSTTFKAEVLQLDSAQINKITIHPPAAINEEPIVISREADNWEVAQGNVKSAADQNTVKNTLGQLRNIKTERLVAKTKDKWATYELTDSLARWIEIQEKGNKNHTKLYFGKDAFFRINDNPETYTVKSDLPDTFDRKFNLWRNSEFMKVEKESITQLKFEAKDKNGYALTKTDSIWTMENLAADSTKVVRYLNRLRNQRSSQFADGFTPKNEADYRLTISGQSMKDLMIEAYRDTTENKFFMSSSQYPDVFVESDSVGLFNRLFVDQDYFRIIENK